MNRETFIEYLKNPRQLDKESLQQLTDLVGEFPYCQSAQILLTMNLYKEKHFRFDDQLKKTAVIANSRSILRRHIEGLNKTEAPVILPDEHAEIPQEEMITEQKEVKSAPEQTEITDKKDNKTKAANELIDEFIRKEPSISRAKATFYNPATAAKTSITDDEKIISETLAKILFDQGQYQKAIRMYEKLSLKNPEKSIYFAALILKAKEELKK